MGVGTIVAVEIGSGVRVGAGVKICVGGAVDDGSDEAELVPAQADRMSVLIHTITIKFIFFIVLIFLRFPVLMSCSLAPF